MASIREEIEGVTEEFEIEEKQEEQRLQFDTSLLMAKTGEGSIENYIDHPLNFNKSKGLGQALRGATGLFGALDLAIIDIVVGILQFMKEKRKETAGAV